MIARRSFLAGLGSMLAAPAIVHAGNLMPISAKLITPDPVVFHYIRAPENFAEMVEWTLRCRSERMWENMFAEMTENNALLRRLSA
jgi:hypothetical protein